MSSPDAAATAIPVHYVGTSWKMNKTIAQAQAFVEEFNDSPSWPGYIHAFIIPPHTLIGTVRDALDPSRGIWVGAQNAHWMASGAYTGEVSMEMIKDAGADLVEIGHSERRAYFNETDESVNLKVHAALQAGLIPLVCVGESLSRRRDGSAVELVLAQIESALGGVDTAHRAEVLVAYEPIWSIGEGGIPATPRDVLEMASAIKASFGVRGLLYGGSVSPGNAAELIGLEGVDGLFVGRSGWTARGLREIVGLAEGAG